MKNEQTGSSLPVNYEHRPQTDGYYEEETSTGTFLVGTVIGAVVGATAALLLAPKSGREVRETIAQQAEDIKLKSIELTNVAMGKTEDFTKQVQEQSNRVLNQAADERMQAPLDDGTVSYEYEESIESKPVVIDEIEIPTVPVQQLDDEEERVEEHKKADQ